AFSCSSSWPSVLRSSSSPPSGSGPKDPTKTYPGASSEISFKRCPGIRVKIWRWRRDLNPRLGVTQHSLSRREPSAARTRHREQGYCRTILDTKSPPQTRCQVIAAAIGGSLRKKSQLLFVFILLEGTEHLICLVLDGISCVGILFLSICNNLLGLAFVRCLFIA